MNITGVAVTAIFACMSIGGFALGHGVAGWIFAVLAVAMGASIALEDDDV